MAINEARLIDVLNELDDRICVLEETVETLTKTMEEFENTAKHIENLVQVGSKCIRNEQQYSCPGLTELLADPVVSMEFEVGKWV